MSTGTTCSICKSKICLCIWSEAVKERGVVAQEVKNSWPRFVQELTYSENQYDSLRRQRDKKPKTKNPNLLPLPNPFIISKVNFNRKSPDAKTPIPIS